MRRPSPLLAAASLAISAAGCAAPIAGSLHQAATGRFAPERRPAVWGRATHALERRASLIQFADPGKGVLTGIMPPASMRCSHGLPDRTCRVTEAWQLTLSEDGVAVLRVDRDVSGETRFGRAPLSRDDVRALQDEVDALVAYIVGAPAGAPAR